MPPFGSTAPGFGFCEITRPLLTALRVGAADLPDAAIGARERPLRSRQRLPRDVLHRAEAGRVEEHGDGVRVGSSRSPGPACRRRSGRRSRPSAGLAAGSRSRAWPGSCRRPCSASTETRFSRSIAVARSGLPSPFRSPIAIEYGPLPGRVVALRPEGAVAPVEEHRDGVRVESRSRSPGPACRRRSGRRSRST